MLPQNGYRFDRFATLINSPEEHWIRLLRRIPSSKEAVDRYLETPLVQNAFRKFNIVDPAQKELTIKKALVLLHDALGSIIASKLMRFQQVETIVGLIPLAMTDNQLISDPRFKESDIQMTVLCRIIHHFVVECGGTNPTGMLFYLLNNIALPYNYHQIIIDQLAPLANNLKQTRH